MSERYDSHPDIPAKLAANPLRTKADFQSAMALLWKPVRRDWVAWGAGATLAPPGSAPAGPGPRAEAFARPLWGIVPWACGGGEFSDWPLVRQVLLKGCDPGHPHFWGEASDCAQPCVEMGAIGFTLALAGSHLFDTMPESRRRRVLTWLAGINAVRLVENNWLFFRVLANLGLRAAGADWSEENVRRDLGRLHSFYRGSGWYTDGPGQSRDHYIGWAMHFYGLLYAARMEVYDPENASTLKQRAVAFAGDFQDWFSRNGAALPFGRSLTYRFAQGAFWGALAYAGVEALPWGVIRGIWARHLRWWWQQPIFDAIGRLTIGYGYPQPQMAERYNCAASPYWSLKAMLPLSLPEDHPFWLAEESPHPGAGEDSVKPQPGAGLILCRDDVSDHVFALSNNSGPADSWLRHNAHKYAKFAYSTRFAFAVAAGNPVPVQLGVDSTLLLTDDGRDWRMRDRIEELESDSGVLHSIWHPWADVLVETWLIPLVPGHVRVHRIRAGRPIHSLEGGFAIGHDGAPAMGMPGGLAVGREAFSRIDCLLGQRRGRTLGMEPGTHLLFPLAMVPILEGDHPAGEHWWITAVLARPDPRLKDASVEWRNGFALTQNPDGFVLTHRDQELFASPLKDDSTG